MRRFKIDVSRNVEEMERILRAHRNAAQCEEAVAILQRWQFDDMLDDASRLKARALVLEFGPLQLLSWELSPNRPVRSNR